MSLFDIFYSKEEHLRKYLEEQHKVKITRKYGVYLLVKDGKLVNFFHTIEEVEDFLDKDECKCTCGCCKEEKHCDKCDCEDCIAEGCTCECCAHLHPEDCECEHCKHPEDCQCEKCVAKREELENEE